MTRTAARVRPRRAAKRARGPDPVSQLKAEVVALGMHVIELRRELYAALRPTPEIEPWDDLIGVAEASQLSGRSGQTIRRWIAAGAPIGGYILSLGIYLISRRRLRAYLLTRNGADHVQAGLKDA